MILPTVRVHHPLDHDVCMVINESDLTDAHVLWGEALASDALRVGKGSRGKWYVKSGRDNVAGPFDTESEAEDAATRM